LTAQARTVAAQHDVSPIVQVQQVNSSQGTVTIDIFHRDDPREQKSTETIPIDQIKPFPWTRNPIDKETIKDRIQESACRHLNLDEPWGDGCESCDPSGKKFQPNEYLVSFDDALHRVTEGGDESVGQTWSTIFTCPAVIQRADEPRKESNPQCKSVIIGTVREQGKNSYSVVTAPTEDSVKRGFLNAYGLPPEENLVKAIDWEEVPDFDDIVNEIQEERIPCGDFDGLWVRGMIRKLLERGYTSSDIGLAAQP
jgi:hypothetical protein